MTTAATKPSPDTFTLTVPKADVNFFKMMAKKMGWTIEHKHADKAATKQAKSQADLRSASEPAQARPQAKPRLYDPETGDYLNDATMKVIENARRGKDVIEVGSMDDYLKLVDNL